MSRIRGLELLFSLVKNQLQSKQDCVVAAIHCLLTDQNLQCVGIGEEFSDSDTRTELLPSGWNQNQEVYTLRYMSADRKNKFLIKIVSAGQIMHANIVLNEEIAAAMSVNVDKHVADDYSDFSSTYLDLESLSVAFRRDILDKLVESSPAKEKAAKSTDSTPKPTAPVNPLQVPPRPPPRPSYDFDDNDRFRDRSPFPHIGGQDLDPLGRASGGMIMDPFGGSRRPNVPPFGLPPGAVPPGARFDPFGPSIPGPNRGRPNPDHFRRPDDFDEFM